MSVQPAASVSVEASHPRREASEHPDAARLAATVSGPSWDPHCPGWLSFNLDTLKFSVCDPKILQVRDAGSDVSTAQHHCAPPNCPLPVSVVGHGPRWPRAVTGQVCTHFHTSSERNRTTHSRWGLALHFRPIRVVSQEPACRQIPTIVGRRRARRRGPGRPLGHLCFAAMAYEANRNVHMRGFVSTQVCPFIRLSTYKGKAPDGGVRPCLTVEGNCQPAFWAAAASRLCLRPRPTPAVSKGSSRADACPAASACFYRRPLRTGDAGISSCAAGVRSALGPTF